MIEIIPGAICSDTQITPNEKRVLAYIDAQELGKPLASTYISQALSLSRTQIVQALNHLLDVGYIIRTAKKRIGYIYRVTFRADSPKNFFLLLSNEEDCGYKRSKLTSLEMMVLAHMQLRQGQNTKMWWRQRCMAADLGVTQQRISRATISLEEAGLIKAERVNGGNKQYNQYQVLATAPIRVFQRPVSSTKEESRTHNRAQIDKNKEFKISDNTATFGSQKGGAIAPCFNTPSALSGDANTGDEGTTRYKLLLRLGIDQVTADCIARDARITTQSLYNLVQNAQAKHLDSGGVWKPRPGYYVKSINAAICEGKQICPTQKSAEIAKKKDAALAFAQSQKAIESARKALRDRGTKSNNSFMATLAARLGGKGSYYDKMMQEAAV